jgi:hypothetical protein
VTKPTKGLTFDAEYVSSRDVDTQKYRGFWLLKEFALRLKDVWGPELRRGTKESRIQAAAGRDFAHEVLSQAKEITIHIPPWKIDGGPLSIVTFDRFVGYVWLDDVCLNELVVAKGYASSTEGGELGV